MSKALVLYWSGTGNTEMMAEAVLEGISNVGMDADLFSVANFDADTVDQYTHFALGCPATGSEEIEEYEFLPVYESIKSNLDNKNVVLFGSHDWGAGEWMENWSKDVVSTKANLVKDGLIVHLTPNEDDLNNCKKLGETLASA